MTQWGLIWRSIAMHFLLFILILFLAGYVYFELHVTKYAQNWTMYFPATITVMALFISLAPVLYIEAAKGLLSERTAEAQRFLFLVEIGEGASKELENMGKKYAQGISNARSLLILVFLFGTSWEYFSHLGFF